MPTEQCRQPAQSRASVGSHHQAIGAEEEEDTTSKDEKNAPSGARPRPPRRADARGPRRAGHLPAELGQKEGPSRGCRGHPAMRESEFGGGEKGFFSLCRFFFFLLNLDLDLSTTRLLYNSTTTTTKIRPPPSSP